MTALNHVKCGAIMLGILFTHANIPALAASTDTNQTFGSSNQGGGFGQTSQTPSPRSDTKLAYLVGCPDSELITSFAKQEQIVSTNDDVVCVAVSPEVFAAMPAACEALRIKAQVESEKSEADWPDKYKASLAVFRTEFKRICSGNGWLFLPKGTQVSVLTGLTATDAKGTRLQNCTVVSYTDKAGSAKTVYVFNDDISATQRPPAPLTVNTSERPSIGSAKPQAPLYHMNAQKWIGKQWTFLETNDDSLVTDYSNCRIIRMPWVKRDGHIETKSGHPVYKLFAGKTATVTDVVFTGDVGACTFILHEPTTNTNIAVSSDFEVKVGDTSTTVGVINLADSRGTGL